MMENRNITKLDIEFYLLNREYADLSVDELKIVSERVASEQEFNEMKAALMGVGSFFKQEEELEPNPAIKIALLKEFNKQQPAGSYWLNGLFVSLFPKEKKLFQKPGVQLIGLAASVMLIVTLTFNLNGDINSMELAQNDEVVSEQKVIDETGLAEKSKTIEIKEEFDFKKEENKDTILSNSKEDDFGGQFVEENELEGDNRGATGGVGYTYDGDKGMLLVSEEDAYMLAIEQEIVNRNKSEVVPARDMAELKKSEKLRDDLASNAVDKLVISGATAPTNGMVESVVVAGASIDMGMEDEEVEIDLPMNSRALSEDADLIGILYTAM